MSGANAWRQVTRVAEAIPIIEGVARLHGWPGLRVQTWPEAAVEAARARLGHIPEQLIEMARWYDDDCWSYCINPAQRRQSNSESRRPDGSRYQRGDSDEWRDEVVFFSHPKHWNRSPDGSIEFASTVYDDEVMLSPSGLITGSDHDNPGGTPFTYSRSLGEWMAKIACCAGIDLCILGGEIDKVPAEHRRAAIEDFNELNPAYPWFR